MYMKKNIAVVGCGHWGKNLVRNFSDLGNLAAVCDPNAEVAQKYADQYLVKNCSFSEILHDLSIEGVVLAVPATLHASMAIEVMNAGKHAYVEKPLAMDNLEAERMIASAEENGVQLMVGHLLQYHPTFMALRMLVESGEMGALQYIYSNRLSFGKVRSEEDVIWSFAPHDISMILSLTGQEPDTVRTESTNILQPDIADTAIVHLEFNSGLKAHISVSWLHPYKEQKLVVVGKKAMAVFDDTKPWGEKLALYRHVVRSSGSLPSLEKVEVEYVEVSQSEPLRNECQHFVDVVSGDITPLTNGKEGLGVLNVLSAASLSQSKNQAVRIENL
ncbi:MAG: UDP-2-acetamido-3-amino-2,3-dideoxy-glucuronate N-acetyltransferase [Chitinophagales bacterium]|jgi:UDP-2-acetamido-3-amino-2,3-dideoxy-glucuronate N-acetyltransferase